MGLHASSSTFCQNYIMLKNHEVENKISGVTLVYRVSPLVAKQGSRMRACMKKDLCYFDSCIGLAVLDSLGSLMRIMKAIFLPN